MRIKNDYPSDWNTRRKRVYQRDEYVCQNCGAKGGSHGNAELHAHHTVPKSKGGTHELTNLTTVCKDCHDAIHHKNKIASTVEKTTSKTHPTIAEMGHFKKFFVGYLLVSSLSVWPLVFLTKDLETSAFIAFGMGVILAVPASRWMEKHQKKLGDS